MTTPGRQAGNFAGACNSLPCAASGRPVAVPETDCPALHSLHFHLRACRPGYNSPQGGGPSAAFALTRSLAGTTIFTRGDEPDPEAGTMRHLRLSLCACFAAVFLASGPALA